MQTVPKQYTGAQSTTVYSVRANSHGLASHWFEIARANLLDVDNWKEIAGPASAEFKVISPSGEPTNKPPGEGDYLRVLLPIKPRRKQAFDWVKVEKIEEVESAGYRFIGMRVRPAVPPFYDATEVAHFFTRDATSTFCVQMQGKRLRAAVYGRNEKPNTNVNRFFNRLKNMLIALGAMMGLNKPQWKSLVKGWLKNL